MKGIDMWSRLLKYSTDGTYRLVWGASWLLTGICILLLTMVVTYSVFMRYVVGKPVYGPNEISEYLFLFSVFLGLAYTQKERAHVRIDMILTRLPERTQTILELITTFLALIFTGVLAWQSWLLAWQAFTSGWKSMTALAIPIFIPQVAIPIGSAALGIALIATLVQVIKSLRRFREKAKGDMNQEPSGEVG
ncbi:TRAP transporter small permease subunit [Chloroflexota bacterium]